MTHSYVKRLIYTCINSCVFVYINILVIWWHKNTHDVWDMTCWYINDSFKFIYITIISHLITHRQTHTSLAISMIHIWHNSVILMCIAIILIWLHAKTRTCVAHLIHIHMHDHYSHLSIHKHTHTSYATWLIHIWHNSIIPICITTIAIWTHSPPHTYAWHASFVLMCITIIVYYYHSQLLVRRID